MPHIVTDEEIALMSADQRRDLILRLSNASGDDSLAERKAVGPREVQILLTVISAVVLIPWIGYLTVALPHVYVTHNWDQAWVGFDILLLLIVATAVLGYLRRHMLRTGNGTRPITPTT